MNTFTRRATRAVLTRRAACAVVFVSAALATSTSFAQSSYPNRPVRLVVPFPQGGGADLTARTFGQKLAERLGQPVVVENRAGANGVLGIDNVVKSPADGYTLLLVDRGATGINPSLYRKLPYDPLRDLSYIGIAAWGPYLLVVNPQVPARTLAELVQLAKSKPGKLNYGSFGIGSLAQLDIEALNQRMGMQMTHVPYKGAALAATATVAGEVDVTVSSAAALASLVKDGRLRALAYAAPKRSPLLPDVPTLGEAGGGEDTIAATYFGFAFASGTPQPIVSQVADELRRIMALPDVAQRLAGAGLDPHAGTPEEMAKVVAEDVKRFATLVRSIGIQPE